MPVRCPFAEFHVEGKSHLHACHFLGACPFLCVGVCVLFMCGCPFRFILTRAHCQYLRVLCPLHLAKGQGGLAARGVLVLRWLTPFTKTPLKDMAEKPSLHSHYLNVTSQLCPGKVGSHRLGRIAKGPKNAAWRWNHYVNVWRLLWALKTEWG